MLEFVFMFTVLTFDEDQEELENMYDSSQQQTKRRRTGKEIILYTSGLYTKFHCN